MQNEDSNTLTPSPETREHGKSEVIISTIADHIPEEQFSQEIRDSKEWLARYLNNSMEDDFRRRYFSRIKTNLKKNLDAEETDTSSNDAIEQKKSSLEASEPSNS